MTGPARGPSGPRVRLTPVRVTVRVIDLGPTAGRRGMPRPSLRPALLALVAEELGQDPADLVLTPRPGRPQLVGGPTDLDLSTSSSGRVGLVGLARGGRLGVDVQQLEDDDLPAAFDEGWLSVRERAAVAALGTPAARRAALTRAWVQKEAVLKGEGVGLLGDLAATETPLADRGRVGRWRLSPVTVPEGHAACVAVSPSSLFGWSRSVRISVL